MWNRWIFIKKKLLRRDEKLVVQTNGEKQIFDLKNVQLDEKKTIRPRNIDRLSFSPFELD